MLCDCGASFGIVPCWQLVALGFGIGVVWATTVQLLLNLTIFRKIASASGASDATDAAKLIQQLSEFSTYAAMLGVGMAYVPYTPCFTDASACWEEIQPVTKLRPDLLALFMLQLSGYVQMTITERLLQFFLGVTDAPKADTLIHHGVTIIVSHRLDLRTFLRRISRAS